MKILFLSDFLPDPNLIIDDALDMLFHDADKIVFNLEGSPMTGSGDDVSYQIMSFNFDFLLAFLTRYGKSKFLIALANNHILDNGFNGFDYLIQKLKDNGIKYFGTKSESYVNVENEVIILNFVTAETVAKYSGNKRLNYLFYNSQNIKKQIKEIEKLPYQPIMYPHWGRDMDTTVFKTYKLNFDNKRWFVFGHHPHVISGISKKTIYSMGNTYIPHPNYYKNYPSMRYGLGIIFDTVSSSYNTLLTTITSSDNYISDFKLTYTEFNNIPNEVLENSKGFSFLKKTYLKAFAFTGFPTDLIRLTILQLMINLFRFKAQKTKKGSHE